MIGARSRCIAGPAARANNTVNSGPRRSAIGDCMIAPSAAPAASRPLVSERVVLAVGDVRHASIKRVSAAVGEGSMGIAVVHQYLGELEAQEQRTQEVRG